MSGSVLQFVSLLLKFCSFATCFELLATTKKYSWAVTRHLQFYCEGQPCWNRFAFNAGTVPMVHMILPCTASQAALTVPVLAESSTRLLYTSCHSQRAGHRYNKQLIASNMGKRVLTFQKFSRMFLMAAPLGCQKTRPPPAVSASMLNSSSS